MKIHHYTSLFEWTGNTGQGTKSYTTYNRDFVLKIDGKMDIPGSSDPSFRGDPKRHNPEELFLSAISSCHALWFLHLCSANQIIVHAYHDRAQGKMIELESGSGKMSDIVLNPVVRIQNPENIELAMRLHHEAIEMCFIANSLNIEVKHIASIVTD